MRPTVGNSMRWSPQDRFAAFVDAFDRAARVSGKETTRHWPTHDNTHTWPSLDEAQEHISEGVAVARSARPMSRPPWIATRRAP